jgi:hypothetical protein
MPKEVSGLALATAVAGGVFLYGGIKGKSPLAATQALIRGSNPSGVPQNAPLVVEPGGGSHLPPGGAGNSGPPSGGSGGSAYSIIVLFLLARFNHAVSAGILGNISVETGGSFSPTSYNPGEGAIGFCQWEGGRRGNLQRFAKGRGTTETDPETQLLWMMREMHGADAGAAAAFLLLQAIPNTRDGAVRAAAIFDANFERSSGEARTDRENRAAQIFGSL